MTVSIYNVCGDLETPWSLMTSCSATIENYRVIVLKVVLSPISIMSHLWLQNRNLMVFSVGQRFSFSKVCDPCVPSAVRPLAVACCALSCAVMCVAVCAFAPLKLLIALSWLMSVHPLESKSAWFRKASLLTGSIDQICLWNTFAPCFIRTMWTISSKPCHLLWIVCG